MSDIINEYKIYDDNFDLNKALNEGGFFDKDNVWNSLMKKGNKLYRVRVETLIINDKGELYLRLYNKENKNYRLPGGSVERNISNLEQASNECKEEAYIVVKNIKDSGLYYIKKSSSTKSILKQNIPLIWDGNYTYIFVGEYDSKYNGVVKYIDKDDDMYSNGKFYDYNYIKDSLLTSHRKAYELYLTNTNSIKTIFYPYYTPEQMKSIGVYNKDPLDNYYRVFANKDNSNWFKTYSETYAPGNEWYYKVKETYLEFNKLDTPENRQSLLELGWNPEINLLNENILYRVTKTTKSIIENAMLEISIIE